MDAAAPLSNLTQMERKLRRATIGIVSITLALVLVPAGVGIYVLDKEQFLSRPDQQRIARLVFPQVEDRVTEQVKREVERATAHQDASLDQLNKRMRNLEAGPQTAILNEVSGNTASISRLSKDVAEISRASSALQEQVKALTEELHQLQGLNTAVSTMGVRQISLSESLTVLNKATTSIQIELSEVHKQQSEQAKKLTDMDARLQKLDDRVRALETRESWITRLYHKATGTEKTNKTQN